MEQVKDRKKIPQWLSITIKIVEWGFIIFIVGCMLSLLAQKAVGETPSLFGYTTYTILTDSMEGTYNVGDVVVVKRIKKPTENDFEVGDVISFIAPTNFGGNSKLEGYTITHRIVEAPYYDEDDDTWYVWTAGDNSAAGYDNVPIPIDNIQGKVVGASTFISWLGKLLSKWYGFVIIIVIPLMAILIWQIFVLAKDGAKKKQEALALEKQRQIDEIQRQVKIALEEDIKKKAIEEYLKNKKEEDNGFNT